MRGIRMFGLGLLLLTALACQWLSPSYWLRKGVERAAPTAEALVQTTVPTVMAPGAQPTPPPEEGAATPAAWGESAVRDSVLDDETVRSFRFTYRMSVQSPALNNGQLAVLWGFSIEVRRDPQLTVHGYAPEGLGQLVPEFYQVGDTIYVKAFDGPWMAASSEQVPDYAGYAAWFTAWDPDWPMLGQETVNGISTRHYRQEVSGNLIPMPPEALAYLAQAGVNPDQVQVERVVVEVYIADPGGWPVKQEARWEGQVTFNGQTYPAALSITAEVRDVNADFEITLPPELSGLLSSETLPLPLPPNATVTNHIGTGAGEMWEVRIPDLGVNDVMAFWEQHPEVTVTSKFGDAAGALLVLTAGGQNFQVTLEAEGNGTKAVVILQK